MKIKMFVVGEVYEGASGAQKKITGIDVAEGKQKHIHYTTIKQGTARSMFAFTSVANFALWAQKQV